MARLQAELGQARLSQSGPERQRLGDRDWVKGPAIGTGAHGAVFVSLNTRTGELMAMKQMTLTEASGQGQADQVIACPPLKALTLPRRSLLLLLHLFSTASHFYLFICLW